MAEVAEQKPIEIKLDDGSVVKAANLEEAIQTVAKMKVDTSQALREARAELDSVKSQVAALSHKEPPKNGNGFNRDSYYKLLNDDPVAAANMVDAYRFDIKDPQDVPKRFNEMYSGVSNLQMKVLGAEFVSNHPEWPGGDEPSKLLGQTMAEMNLPANQNGLEVAYNHLVRTGKVTPNKLGAEADQDEPNPSIPGGAAGSFDAQTKKAESLDDKELEALLRSKGMLK